MAEFAYKPSYEIARRLEMRGENSYSWSILIAPPTSDAGAMQEFAEELEAFVCKKPRILDITRSLVTDLRDQLQKPPDDPVILVGFDGRGAEILVGGRPEQEQPRTLRSRCVMALRRRSLRPLQPRSQPEKFHRRKHFHRGQ
jgi:hypothetical protein